MALGCRNQDATIGALQVAKIDFSDPGTNADPFPAFARLQEDDPVHWSASLKAWIITRYADVRQVALNNMPAVHDFPADAPHGSGWYRRAMRAHANCLESLPLYAAIVVAIAASGVHSRTLDALAIALLVARVVQTVTHVSVEQTNTAVGIRFVFFFIQIACMSAMGILIALRA